MLKCKFERDEARQAMTKGLNARQANAEVITLAYQALGELINSLKANYPDIGVKDWESLTLNKEFIKKFMSLRDINFCKQNKLFYSHSGGYILNFPLLESLKPDFEEAFKIYKDFIFA